MSSGEKNMNSPAIPTSSPGISDAKSYPGEQAIVLSKLEKRCEMTRFQFQSALGEIRRSISGLAHKLLPITSAAILFTLFSSGSTVMEAQKAAGSNRPTTVPSDYVITPFGYFHPTCFKRLTHGDVLQKDQGIIQHKDGTYDPLRVCEYPRYDHRGAVVSDTKEKVDTITQKKTTPPSISHSWIEAYSATTSSSFGLLEAQWIVPPAPTSNDGQTVYFFPGMEDYNDVISIIQPVLGWNGDYVNAWGIASWNCCISGITYESSPVPVTSGDTIWGIISPGCFPRVESCGGWNIDSVDTTSGKSTQLALTPSDGQTFNWAFAGAVEVYDITQCSDYPPQAAITFSSVVLQDYNGNVISNPNWSFLNYSTGLTPQCNYTGTEDSAQEVKLFFGASVILHPE